MSVSRHHADWLSLVEVSGPFVSLQVLMRVFPQGLEPRDPAQAKSLRDAYGDWQDNPAAPGRQRAWVMHVLTAVLGYPHELITENQTIPAGLEPSMPEMGETLRPDFALIGPAGSDIAGQVQLLIASYPADQALGKPVVGKHWKATPATRMMELLHGAGVPLGLVTNGEEWMLVYGPRGETTGYASWYGALWLDEPITLRAFHSLLGVRRFFGVAADSTLLALLKESANDQQEVTDQLGYQVREAVEVLVQNLDALDKESNRTLLKGVSETTVYDAALTIMMRLVFLFSAEERDLLHLGKPLYDDNYAVSTLQEQLQEVADRYGEEVLERRYDAWVRLLATFRAVHGGIQHQDLLMQAYGGSLFDPDRYPFLEGRPANTTWQSTVAEPLAVNNRVVLHLLNSLQRLRIKAGAGGTAETRRVSFRALGVEQIGHVYEGLLAHTAVRAAEAVLGIKGTRSKEPEIPLAILESLQARGRDKLIEFLKNETGRSVSALSRALEEGSLVDEHKLLTACGQDETLLDHLRPFVGLIRGDSFERPLVFLPDSVYVTTGTTRRSTGTHYTPPSLTEPIVQYTLEPLVYEGPAEGWPREQWQLKSPKAILDLKVCDMTMGSGAFLVQACRYLAERLVEAWENAEKLHPGQILITPDGEFSKGSPTERLVPADASERITIARRSVADRCLYGVDINPMAVEMAKLSLWLITVDRHRPFTFLDHAFKCGDSLLGITSLEQLESFSLRPGEGKQRAFATVDLKRHIDDAVTKRQSLEAMPSDTPEQIAAKTGLFDEAEEAVASLNAAANVLVAVELKGLTGKAYNTEREATVDRMMVQWAAGLAELQAYANQRLVRRPCFHWALAFPEISRRGGFDAFIGNPPFQGGTKISKQFGRQYLDTLLAYFDDSHGKADICAYFLRQTFNLLNADGCGGLVTTNTITQGATRESGLAFLEEKDVHIFRAVSSIPWPGDASVQISMFNFSKSRKAFYEDFDATLSKKFGGNKMKNGGNVAFPLAPNGNISFIGTVVIGKGFEIDNAQRSRIIRECPECASIIKPYINGVELNRFPDLQPRRYIIDFGKLQLEEARAFAPCFKVVEEAVLPQRLKTEGSYKTYWWRFGRRQDPLYEAIQNNSRVLVVGQVGKHLAFAFLPAGMVYDQKLIVFTVSSWGHFTVLQSSLHHAWARRPGSLSLRTDPTYTVQYCSDTFPFPLLMNNLLIIGETYYMTRSAMLLKRNEGLTRFYNNFHNDGDDASDLWDLRRLHIEMDKAVAAAYGWGDLDLGHGFHETKEGIRFTISEPSRREILDRLLALNQKRHAEEEVELRTQPARLIPRRGRAKTDAGEQISIEL